MIRSSAILFIAAASMLCCASRALAQPEVSPVSASPLVPQALSAPSEADIALACASVRAMLEEYTKEKDPAKQAELLAKADKRLRPIVSDPRVEALEPWRLAGVVASQRKDVELAAFAFEAIERIKPGFAADEKLTSLMGRLDAMDVQERVTAIRRDRESVIADFGEAGKGDAAVLFRIGYAYGAGQGVPKYEPKAVEWWIKAAQAGHTHAMFNLGVMYANGQGVSKDEAKAVEWYTKAAQAGHEKAMFFLGRSYAYGQGVSKDKAKAVEWYTKAAQAGDTIAMFNLGESYADGQGVSKDEAKAVEWYTKAAQAGDTFAMLRLGEFYDYGLGVSKDEAKAVEWWTKAAQMGDETMKFDLGWRYDYGLGVSKDEAKAVEWYIKAAQAGHTDAQDALRKRGLAW